MNKHQLRDIEKRFMDPKGDDHPRVQVEMRILGQIALRAMSRICRVFVMRKEN